MFALGFPELILIIFGLAIIGFEIAMLIHVARNKQFNVGKKALWVVAILALHLFAAAYYYFSEYRHHSSSAEVAA